MSQAHDQASIKTHPALCFALRADRGVRRGRQRLRGQTWENGFLALFTHTPSPSAAPFHPHSCGALCTHCARIPPHLAPLRVRTGPLRPPRNAHSQKMHTSSKKTKHLFSPSPLTMMSPLGFALALLWGHWWQREGATQHMRRLLTFSTPLPHS